MGLSVSSWTSTNSLPGTVPAEYPEYVCGQLTSYEAFMVRPLVLLFLVAMLVIAQHHAVAAPLDIPNEAISDQRIARLIEQLGDAEYSTREKAQAELKRLGLVAFDGLFEAILHEDIEIARRARYLLKCIPDRWLTETDSPEVKMALRNYSVGSNHDRRSHMDRLALLPNGLGIESLCRLARFETDHVLSKHAALLVMGSIPAAGKEQEARVELIRQAAGRSNRPAAHWLRLFANTLESAEATLPAWERVVRGEEGVFSLFPERTDLLVLRNLMRWHSELLQRCHHETESIAAVRRSFDILRGEPEDLIDMANWLLNRKLWTLVEELAQRFGNRFDDSLELLYVLAEAQLHQNKTELAQQTADHARALEGNPLFHIRQARTLQERGLFDWSEKEFKRVFELAPKGESADFQARGLLTELLHDLERDLAAGEVWKELFDAAEKDRSVSDLLGKNTADLRPFRARMHYYFAMHFHAIPDLEKEKTHLEKAVTEYPGELDALIGMYRFAAADDAWRKKTRDLISATAGRLQDEISQLDKILRQTPNDATFSDTRQELAQKHNEFAWLIGNTIGDYDLAIRSSKRSLELAPGSAAYLDTLGRCYFAKGDYANAVKHQLLALHSEPYSGQMKRQLRVFQEALDPSKTNRETK